MSPLGKDETRNTILICSEITCCGHVAAGTAGILHPAGGTCVPLGVSTSAQANTEVHDEPVAAAKAAVTAAILDRLVAHRRLDHRLTRLSRRVAVGIISI